jgi:hypothetical protein
LGLKNGLNLGACARKVGGEAGLCEQGTKKQVGKLAAGFEV